MFPTVTVTVAGTVTEGSELLNETVTPPAGAAWLIVTVPVEFVPPVTDAGLRATPLTVSVKGATVTFCVIEVVPVVAVTTTVVELLTAFAVALKV